MGGSAGSDAKRRGEQAGRTVQLPGGATRDGARGVLQCGDRLECERQHRKGMGGCRLQRRVDRHPRLARLFVPRAAVVGGRLIVTGRMLRALAARHAVARGGFPACARDGCSGAERQGRKENRGEEPPHTGHSSAESETSRPFGRRWTPDPRQGRLRRCSSRLSSRPTDRATPRRRFRHAPRRSLRSRRSGDRPPR